MSTTTISRHIGKSEGSSNLYLELRGPDSGRRWSIRCVQTVFEQNTRDHPSPRRLDSLAVIVEDIPLEASKNIAEELHWALSNIYKMTCPPKAMRPLQAGKFHPFLQGLAGKSISFDLIRKKAAEILSSYTKEQKEEKKEEIRPQRPPVRRQRPAPPPGSDESARLLRDGEESDLVIHRRRRN